MRAYGPYVGGEDREPERWIHTIRASALLDDAFSAVKLKRDLDRGGSASRGDPRLAGQVGVASREQVSAASAAARAAQPAWARTPLSHRLAFGAAVHDAVNKHASDFIDVLIAEGHPRRLAEWEVAGILQGSCAETLETCASMMERVDRVGQREVRLVRKPDGVVGVSPPQNAAASNSMLGLQALVAGNALVVKAPRSCPLGVAWAWREIVAPVLDEFGAPPGTLNVICGAPVAVLDQWMASPDVDSILFFGDSVRGIEVGNQCMARGKKPILELSGNDGVLVWEDAELELAARALAECFYGSAQICMVPKYAVVHPRVVGRLSELLVEQLAQARPGMPEDPDALLTPVLKTQKFFAALDQARASGAEVVTGGERMDGHGAPASSGVFLQPTVLRIDGLAAAAELEAVRQETFYPMLPLVVPDEGGDEEMFDAALAFLNDNPYGLRNSLWSRDPVKIDEFCARVDNGGLLKVNDSHLGFVPTLPTHGGAGLSGGPLGEANFPMLRTSRLQGISIATEVSPRHSVFDSALPQRGQGMVP